MHFILRIERDNFSSSVVCNFSRYLEKRARTDHLVLYTRNCVHNIRLCFKKESSYFLGKRLKATVPLHPHATANAVT